MAKSKKKDTKKANETAVSTAKKQSKKSEHASKAIAKDAQAPVDATAAASAPKEPDPRLPAAGTVLQKRDRHGEVRCECTIEEGGIRYAGKVYRSLSAAAMAAAKELGLTNKTQNGFTFWGLSKPPRRPGDPLVALDRAWGRYHARAEGILKSGVIDENRVKILSTVKKHFVALEALRERVA